MHYDPLVALSTLSPIEKLSDENSKKKSRWGNNANNSLENKVVPSKWGDENYKPYLPLPFVDFPPGLTPSQLDQFLREQRYDELTKKLNKGELEHVDPDIRPASPPPIYDKNGNRINTREARIKNSMIEEHHRLVEYLLKHVEGFVAPSNYKPIKKIRKIEIPIDKYPEYNFMGLIIGPRGCNHKRLEAESGAQISIRGKGTQKEGKKTDHQTDIEANMPKHVHISGDTEECVERAVSLITPLLDPTHPLHEEFKKKGLEQLALVNGINLNQLETQRCAMCNSTTHLTHECPENMNIQNFKKPEIKCNLCGDHGHITLDCKLAKQNNFMKNNFDPANIPAPPPDDGMTSTYDRKNNYPYINKQDKTQMDMEYQKMMSELNKDWDGTNNNQKGNKKNNTNNYSSNDNANINDGYPFSSNSNNFSDTSNSKHNNKNYGHNMMPQMNMKNMNNPNFIPLGKSNNSFNDDLKNVGHQNYYNTKTGVNNNDNEQNFNANMNYQGMANMPLNPPLPMLPNFFNFSPFMNTAFPQNGALPYPNGQQMPMDPMYMQAFPGWPQIPMNYSEDFLAQAAAPDTNPPPLPSENANPPEETNDM
ncbi:hypothetical protein YYE_02482 [Plasmodium vinckei vinckei]|nr:hypothetical protein YYE_02482 [Plasmodium vinckei vinckei]